MTTTQSRWSIPDMCTTGTNQHCWAPTVSVRRSVTMVIPPASRTSDAGTHSRAAGIKNVPTEEKNYKVGADPAADYRYTEGRNEPAATLPVLAKISSVRRWTTSAATSCRLVGSGFNDGTTATAYVLGRKPIHRLRVVGPVGLRAKWKRVDVDPRRQAVADAYCKNGTWAMTQNV